MTLLLLIRHALTDATGTRLTGRMPGMHLSEAGKTQAEELANRLRVVPLTHLYSSPLERCRETAAPIARATGLRVKIKRDLAEVDYGDWTGRPLAQLARTKLWKTIHEHPSAVQFPNGERLLDVQSRVMRAATQIAAAHPRGVVAMFSHGDAIRLLLAGLAGVPIDLFQRITVSPVSVSAVALGGGQVRILRMNDTGYLSDLARQRPRGGSRGGKVRG